NIYEILVTSLLIEALFKSVCQLFILRTQQEQLLEIVACLFRTRSEVSGDLSRFRQQKAPARIILTRFKRSVIGLQELVPFCRHGEQHSQPLEGPRLRRIGIEDCRQGVQYRPRLFKPLLAELGGSTSDLRQVGSRKTWTDRLRVKCRSFVGAIE